MRRDGSARLAWGLVLPGLLLGAWEAAVRAGVLDPVFFPPPSALAQMAMRLCATGELPRALLATLRRAAMGFVPGALAGIGLGVAMGRSSVVRRMFEPALAGVYAMPKLALLPVSLLILGVGETARLALIALGALLIMTQQVFDGVRAIDGGYVELAHSYGASPWLRWRRVYLPGALPSILTGTRITFGRCLVVAISAELVMGSPGLGSMIWMAWQTFSTERLYVSVAAAGLLGMLSQALLRSLEKRLVPWRES
jgi:ABC-type nitrate/sulfonate/bicarbonate transport system permease component